jgi:hypothetical protein
MEFKGSKEKWGLTKVPMQEDIPTGRTLYSIDSGDKTVINTYDGGDEETAANFALMSASPELLDLALEVLKIWNEDGDNGDIQMKTPIAWQRAVTRAEKAIEKAIDINKLSSSENK